VVAPGAVVGQVHAPLALAQRRGERAVHVEHRLVEELVGLLAPNREADLVEEVLKRLDIGGREAAAEVARGGRVRDALGAEGVEVDLVVAEQFQVLQAGAAGQEVVADCEEVKPELVGARVFRGLEPAQGPPICASS
jgi:hypothetical protein